MHSRNRARSNIGDLLLQRTSPSCRQGKTLRTEGLERSEGLEDGGPGHSRRVQAALGS